MLIPPKQLNAVSQPSRRDVLKAGLATAAVLSLPRFAIGQGGGSPNDKVRLAAIGTGNEWNNRLKRPFGQGDGSEFVALCDVDLDTLNSAGEDFPKARKFQDFRKMFDEMVDEIDGVVIATPDHWHCYQAALSMHLGKHVFCEKPLCRTISEVRTLAQWAEKNPNLATQMGNQGHSSRGYALFRDLYQSGLMGEVTEIHVWSGNKSGRYFSYPNEIPPPEDPVPESLDWDLWLGPAELRPYNSNHYHPRVWRGWWDFGTGLMGDVAIHTADAAIYAMDLPAPYKAEADMEGYREEYMPKNSTVRLYFQAPHQEKEVVLHWYEDPKDAPRPADLEKDRKLPRDGLFMVGDKMTVLGQGMRPNPIIIPEEKRRATEMPEEIAPRYGNHYQDWVKACKDPSHPVASPFPKAAELMESILVGVLAQRANKTIEYDPTQMAIKGMPELQHFLQPTYHNDFPYPDLA